METQTITYYVQLKAQIKENLGYIQYVFENLNFKDYDNVDELILNIKTKK